MRLRCIRLASDTVIVDFHVRKPAPPKPSWSRATQVQRDDFKNHLEEALLKIKIPVSILDCNDVHCDDPAHLGIADNLRL